MGWTRWLVYTICLFTMLISMMILGITIWAKVEDVTGKTGFTAVLKIDFLWIIIIFAFVVFLISFLGALGVLREYSLMLRIYNISLMILVILEVIGVILVVAFSGRISILMEKLIVYQVSKYDTDISAQNFVDLVQLTFKCCGGESLIDYNQTQIFNCQNPTSLLACGVPYSCCSRESIEWDCGKGVQKNPIDIPEHINTSGCASSILDFVKTNIIALGVTFGVIIVLELICLTIVRKLRIVIEGFRKIYEHKKGSIFRME